MLSLKIYWSKLGIEHEETKELHRRLGELCNGMRTHIISVYENAPEERAGLKQFAITFDLAIAGLEGACAANLKAELDEKVVDAGDGEGEGETADAESIQ